MTNEDAAAVAALNQTIRQLVSVLAEIHADLDRLGYPKGDASDREQHGDA